MIATPIFERDTPRLRLIYAVCLLCSIGFILLKAYAIIWYIDGDLVSAAGNDNLIRLVSVRNWLAGQAWFDTIEYRLMPPEGVQMHWSRYIDAILGGIIVLLSGFMPTAEAEMWAMYVWPVFLSILLVVMFGVATFRLFGPVAASFAALTASIWPVTQQFYFLPGNIDHHNVQIVLIVALTLLVLSPKAPFRSGLLAGVAAALALAIGLETLLYILVLGVVLFARANLRMQASADPLLAGFSIALLAGGIVFWLGQTAPARLGVQVCDQLGLPVIALTAIACAASLLPMLLFREKALMRLLLGGGVVLIGCVIAWPLLGPCLAGPYGSLPLEVQEIISDGIVEALPGPRYASRYPVMYVQLIAPVAGALVLGALQWLRMRKDAEANQRRRDILGMLLVLSCVGLLASFWQIRLLLMSAPAAPILVGVVMALLIERYLKTRGAADAVIMLVAAVVLVAPLLMRDLLRETVFPADASAAGRLDAACRDTAMIESLNDLAPAVFLTTINLGPAVLAGTHHATISGPYHRSPDAFANGSVPFRLNEAELRTYILKRNATHLMLCQGSDYGEESFATALARGAQADWLEPVVIDTGEIRVFEIVPEG